MSTMPCRVRRAEVRDARAIAEIHVAGWRAAYRGQMPDELLDGLSVDARAAQRQAHLANPSDDTVQTWVAEVDGVVVGFAVAGPSRGPEPSGEPEGEMYAIYVDPARWGQRTGRTLLEHVKGDLRARGYRTVTLWVLAGNALAQRFYAAAGLAPDGGTKTERFGEAELTELRYRAML
jgi:ribosomal protein S18 acetylase RimI-like enzyme